MPIASTNYYFNAKADMDLCIYWDLWYRKLLKIYIPMFSNFFFIVLKIKLLLHRSQNSNTLYTNHILL